MHYSEQNNKEFERLHSKWKHAWLHYSGEYACDPHIPNFLHRKEQRETQKAYQERQDLTDPVLYFSECVDSLNGIIGANEEDDKREWGELGDPEEPDSISYTLKKNADGDGMNWSPLFKQVGIKLTVMHKIWGLVEGVKVETDDNGETERTLEEAKIKIIDPQSVVNWWPKTGNPQQVLVKEEQDTRTSIRDTEEDDDSDVYVLYELDGWTRFQQKKNDSGDVIGEEVIALGAYEYWNDTDRSIRVLPIFPVEIPMPRHVGHLLAKKQEHIYNKKSRRDFAIMNMSFSLLRMVADKDQYNDLINDLDKGYNIIRQDPEASGEHGYMSPPSDYLTTYGEILEKDKEDFYDAAFKQYGDAAKQVTATEVRLESRSGIEAFLSLLVTSIDEFENAAMWRLMQVYFSESPQAWGTANVKRSQDFAPEDIKEVLNQLSSAILNADRAGAMSKKTMIETLHPEWGEEEVEEELQRINEERGASPLPDAMQGA